MKVVGLTFADAYRQALAKIMESPDHVCSPRGVGTREVLGAQLVVLDPRARVLGSAARKADYRFAAGEFCWYARGADDVASIAHYNKRMPQFSDDGERLESAYGARVGLAAADERDDHDGFSALGGQWDMAARELLSDRDSRRAVLSIYHSGDLRRARWGTKDVPCTTALQFLVRERRVCLVATMRSCDAVWGLTYDAFSFSLLQELMLLELRARGATDLVGLGPYRHFAASLHVYERHHDLARAVAAEAPAPIVMPPLDSPAAVRALLAAEVALRRGEVTDASVPFGSGEEWLLARLREVPPGPRILATS